MPGGEPGDDQTLGTDAGIASDETLAQSAGSSPQHVTTGRVIRVNRQSLGPSQLGRYEIVRPIGRGGMGAVFEAEDPELGRRVAIKVLRDDRDDPTFTERLRHEAQALAKLVHSNVVTVYDVGVDDGQVFIVMQLIEGEAIDRWLRDARPRAIVDAFRQAGKGLAAAHAAGLVHCDFKPANVLVDKDGAIRVSDFGLARIGADDASSIAGTPAYMAPEQFSGVATSASDQYAFCVALYEVLTGVQPFRDSKIDDPDAARARVAPPIPRAAHVPAPVARALQRGLAPAAADRFPSMDALLAALAPPKRRWWFIAAGAAVLAVAGTALSMSALRAPVAVEPVVAPRQPGQPDLAAAHPLTTYGTSACAYAPSIDGNVIVFDRTEGDAVDLYAMPLAGGTARQITSAPTWEWRSNPGRHPGEVVHLIHDPNVLANAKIAYLDVASGRETVAASVLASDAVATTNGVVYVSRTGEELRRSGEGHDIVLARAPQGRTFNQLAIAHSGDRLAAVADGKPDSLCVIDAVTGKSDCVDTDALVFRPAFGAGDRFLYYAANDGIHRRELATRADVLIVPGVIPRGGIAVAADGHALVYSDCGTRSQIFDWATQPPTMIVDDPTASAPNGTATDRLVWLRIVNGVQVLMARQGRRDIQITDAGFGAISHPAMSPDGTRVVFRSRAPHAGIYVSKLEPGQMQRISDDPRDDRPVWIDNVLAFARYVDESPTVFVATSDGGNPRALRGTSRFPIGGSNNRVLVQSHARVLAADVTTGVEHDGPYLANQQLMNLATSPNGRWLVARSGGNAQLLNRMKLGSPDAKLEHLPAVAAGQTIAGAAITDDGHVLAAVQTWSGDLYVVPAKPGAPF